VNNSDRTPTVLVVEDEPIVLLNASEIVEQAGWLPLEATNSAEALKVLADHPDVDVLFTDINMPGEMDGVELARHVHKILPQVHLVVTSGKRYLDDCVLPDTGTFLPKPYGYDELVGVIARKLASAS
jgi:CheY-like chemotaxis protein